MIYHYKYCHAVQEKFFARCMQIEKDKKKGSVSTHMTDTIAAIATPPGQGGIAVVRLSGPDALAVGARVFRPANPAKRLQDAPGYTALFGHFYAGGRRRDETVALVFRAPKSYTGEDVVELSCHGGTAVVRLLLDACLAAGAVMAPPGAFTRRAFENGRLSLTQAEAVMDMVAADNTQAAAAAAAAMDGALWREVQDIRAKLLELAAHIAAWCDYPEEEVPALTDEALASALTAADARLQKLIDAYDRGTLLRRGVPTAIVGAPNVGKSTLLNLLTGRNTAIVTPVAGTTRDVVEDTVCLGEVTLRLADTAGLHRTGDIVEREGIRRSLQRLQQAALVLAVFDCSRPATAEEVQLARTLARAALAKGGKTAQPGEESAEDLLRQENADSLPSVEENPDILPQGEQDDDFLPRELPCRPTLFIFNKTDLPPVTTPCQLLGELAAAAPVLTLSATDPDSRPQLEAAITHSLRLDTLDPDAALLANRRQLESARRAHQALAAAQEAMALGLDAVGVCIQDALDALCALTGENAADSVIDEVFSAFCVGK